MVKECSKLLYCPVIMSRTHAHKKKIIKIFDQSPHCFFFVVFGSCFRFFPLSHSLFGGSLSLLWAVLDFLSFVGLSLSSLSSSQPGMLPEGKAVGGGDVGGGGLKRGLAAPLAVAVASLGVLSLIMGGKNTSARAD